MNDPLTVQEVERYCRLLRSALTTVPLPANTPNTVRRKLDEATGLVDELLLLCELVDVVASGIAVMVEPDDVDRA